MSGINGEREHGKRFEYKLMKYLTAAAVPDGDAALVHVRVLQLLLVVVTGLVVEVANVVEPDVVAAVPGTHWAGNRLGIECGACGIICWGEHREQPSYSSTGYTPCRQHQIYMP